MRSERNGFTLIELLIVVVIIGILAAIAVPKFGATKDKAKLASVKADLRNLVSAQEAYISDNGVVLLGGPIPDPTFAYQPSAGVTVTMDGINGGSRLGSHRHVQRVHPDLRHLLRRLRAGGAGGDQRRGRVYSAVAPEE